jgi:microcystin-dependent protein
MKFAMSNIKMQIKFICTSAILKAVLSGAALFAALPASACDSTEPYMGSICTTAANFCPNDYQLANGAILEINKNSALYSLLLNRFGGDGKTTFALPDLRSRMTMATNLGQNPGSQRGADAVTLSVSNLPSHSHAAIYSKFGGDAKLNVAIPVSKNTGVNTQITPDLTHRYLAESGTSTFSAAIWASAMTQATTIQGVTAVIGGGNGVVTVENTGSSQSVPTSPPQVGLTHCIAVRGFYPMRN